MSEFHEFLYIFDNREQVNSQIKRPLRLENEE
jgi:hypothetical protein